MTRDRHQQHQDAVRVFKGETVFDWDAEPTDERPSAFVESTQYGTLWAPSTRSMTPALEIARPRPAPKRGGIGGVWIAIVIGFAVAAGVIVGYVKSQRVQRAELALGSPRVASADI